MLACTYHWTSPEGKYPNTSLIPGTVPSQDCVVLEDKYTSTDTSSITSLHHLMKRGTNHCLHSSTHTRAHTHMHTINIQVSGVNHRVLLIPIYSLISCLPFNILHWFFLCCYGNNPWYIEMTCVHSPIVQCCAVLVGMASLHGAAPKKIPQHMIIG